MDQVRTLDTGIASGLVTVLVDELGGGSSSIQTPAADFEAAERGVAIGRRFIPWHRVRRYEWDLPPKPKWMRWATYNRHVDRYDRYEDILDYGCVALAAKLGKNFFL